MEISGGFYVTRLSLEQYGCNDNLNCMDGIFKYRKVQEANKANSLLSLTYWLRIHVAKGSAFISQYCTPFIYLSLLFYPLTQDILQSSIYVQPHDQEYLDHENQSTLPINVLSFSGTGQTTWLFVMKAAFPYIGIKSLFSSKYITLLILV